MFWKGGRLREVVAREGWTVKKSLLFQTRPQGNVQGGTWTPGRPDCKSNELNNSWLGHAKSLPCCTASFGKTLIKKKPISSGLFSCLFWLFNITIELYTGKLGFWVLLRSKSKITLRAETTVQSPKMAVSNLCSQVSQRYSFKKITWKTHVFWSQVIHWTIISLFTYYFWILICNIFCEHIFSLEALSPSLPKAPIKKLRVRPTASIIKKFQFAQKWF